jgi:hypothetical protein
LKDVINLWEGTNKTIVNINSKTMLIPKPPEFLKEYAADKKNQYDLTMSRIFKASPQIINITLGLVDTKMAKVFESKKINSTDLASFIYHVVDIRKILAIQDLLIEVPDLDWNDIKQV